MISAPYRRLEGSRFMDSAHYRHDMITAQGLISAPYRILEGNGFP